MGQLRFVVSPPECITEEVLQFTYMAGIDRTPWVAEVQREDSELVLERDVDDSGCVTVPWHVDGHGVVALTTGTLIERWEPYHLPLELARGTLNLLRTQLYDWQEAGIPVPDEVNRLLKQSQTQFSQAVVQPLEDGGLAAGESVRLALDAGQLLAAAYADQVIANRRRLAGRLPSILGGELANAGMDAAAARWFSAAFNVAWLPIYWRDVEAIEGEYDWTDCDRRMEWCRAQGIRTCLGPLVQLDARGLPDWVYLWEDDFESLAAAAGEFVEAAVNRYRGKVDLWHCAAKANTSHALKFSDEERLRLVAWVVCRVKQLDPDRPHLVGIDQPLGEYLRHTASDLSPLQFADALVRSHIDLKAILLEMNFACCSGGTLPRSELDLNRQLDFWSGFGLPLLVGISLPSDDGADPQARQKPARQAGTPPSDDCSAAWSLERQQGWAARYLPLLLAKPGVYGVLWNQFEDARPHEFPHAGLVAPEGQAKPALRTLAALRAALINPRPPG